MKHLRLIIAVAVLVLSVSLLFAASPNDPVNDRLRTVYRRVHFSQQYPPEAAQFIQSRLQDAEDPLPVLEELAGDERPEVRTLVTMLLGEYGESGGSAALWKLMRDDAEPVRMTAAAGLMRLSSFTSFPISTEGLKDSRAVVRRFNAATLADLHDKTAESDLIEALKDEDEMVRMEVTRALGNVGTENCVPALAERLHDPSVMVRQGAANSLSRFSSPTVAEILLRVIDDPDWHVRGAVIRSLGFQAQNPQISDAILNRLINDEFALVRDRAADALAMSTDERAINALVMAVVAEERDVRFHASQAIITGRSISALPKLMEHRNDPNVEVREKIVEIFGRIGGSAQVTAVIEATNDPEPQVQLAAVNALQRLRERGATEQLLTKLGDPNPHVRAAVCRALGDIGEKSAGPKIVPLLRDDNGYVRGAAAEALGKLGDRSSIAPLLQVLSGDNISDQSEGVVIGTKTDFLAGFSELTGVQQKTRAVEALGVLRAPEAVDPIIKHGLKSEDPVLRAVSAYSLGQIRDGRAIEPLQDAVRPYYSVAPTDLEYVIDPGTTKVDDEARRLKEKEARVRASVAWALGQLGDPSARDTLLKAVNDQNSLVRDAAVEALAKIAEREEKLATADKPARR